MLKYAIVAIDVAATIAIRLRIGMVISVESLISMTLLQPLSKYHGSKNKRVQGKHSVSIACYVFVGRIHFFVKALEAFFTELFVVR
jgi:hypothetical protein